MKKVLHAGCGFKETGILSHEFNKEEWEEIRYDINPIVEPDFVGSITNMDVFSDNSFDAVYSYHNLEHVNNFEIDTVLNEFKRVLKPKGLIFVVVPDILMDLQNLIEGKIEETIFTVPKGNVTTLSLLYGFDPEVKDNEFMLHKTGFTKQRLLDKLNKIGFININVYTENNGFDLCGKGLKNE